jgi:hypothetical protein
MEYIGLNELFDERVGLFWKEYDSRFATPLFGLVLLSFWFSLIL